MIRRRLNPRAHRCVGAVTGVTFMMVALATPATALQPDAEQTPTPAPTPEEAGTEPGGFGLDFGDAVIIDEDGTVIWNQETETDEAEATPTPEPTVTPRPRVDGTGTGEEPAVTTGSDDGPTSSTTAGAGNSLSKILGVAGISVASVIAMFVFIRSRREAAAELEMVEDVITPAGALLGEDPTVGREAPYPGADDTGAYEVGGAAYAQHTEPGYEAVKQARPQPKDRLDQLRSSMADLADKRLAEAGHDRAMAKKLEAAGSKMRPGEWVVMAAAGTVGAFFGAAFVFGWLLAIVAAGVVAGGFWWALSRQETKRQKLFAEALPETLGLLAGSLRGGSSMIQAIQTVADEADEPTAEEFQRVITEARLGRDLAVAFRDLSVRMASNDFEWVVTAIEIHREVGGDLSLILDRVSNTIRSRNRVRGQVKALSAEGRASGMILFALPPVMLLGISIMNPEYLAEMTDDTGGQLILVGATVLLLFGGAWLKRLARFVY